MLPNLLSRRSTAMVLALAASLSVVHAQSATPQSRTAQADPAAPIRAAADAFLATLEPAQRKQVSFAFDDDAQRRRWSNLPSGMFERRGLRLGDLTAEQSTALFALLRATLSERGMQQVIDNIDSDEVLRERSERGGLLFGRDFYYVALLGEPSADRPWMWQFGGHHLALNATVVGERVTLAPSITGGRPVEFERDGRKVHQLGDEEAAAHRLLASLTPEQRAKAVVSDTPADWAFGPNAEATTPREEGIRGDALDAPQRELLLDLIRLRVGIVHAAEAERTMRRIAEDLPATWFAWFGPTDPKAAANFRIQGPSVIVEYAPQHTGGDPRDHLHAIYRDPANDYGAGFVDGRLAIPRTESPRR